MTAHDVVGAIAARLREGSRLEPGLASALRARCDAATLLEVGELLESAPDASHDVGGGRPPLRIAVTATFTVATVGPILRASLFAAEIPAQVDVGGHDQLAAALGDPESSLAQAKPDVVVCALHDGAILPQTWDPTDLAALRDTALTRVQRITELISAFAARTGCTIVAHTIPLTSVEWRSIISHRDRARLGQLWREVNGRLLDLAQRSPNCHVIDMEMALVDTAATHRDPRLHAYASMSWSQATEALYAAEVAALCRGLCARQRKLLVTDLDNTLWGGVVGECGVDGLELGPFYPGNAFVDLQRRLGMLRRQGVLLAISSKNDSETVAEVHARHPSMILTENDFVATEINWGSKVEAIQSIARRLNIGLGSIVFVDDSAWECHHVGLSLPEVEVVRLDGDPSSFAGQLLAGGRFDVPGLTATDLVRTDLYRTEMRRRELADVAVTHEDYLRSLDLRVTVHPAEPVLVPRVVQLLARTNQFNTTGLRLSAEGVRSAIAAADQHVLVVDVADIFATEDTVSAIVLTAVENQWRIQVHVMSCRVFSRGIEFAVLQHVAELAHGHGAHRLLADVIPTTRNGPARDAYERAGFRPAEDVGTTTATTLELPLSRLPNLRPAWIR